MPAFRYSAHLGWWVLVAYLAAGGVAVVTSAVVGLTTEDQVAARRLALWTLAAEAVWGIGAVLLALWAGRRDFAAAVRRVVRERYPDGVG